MAIDIRKTQNQQLPPTFYERVELGSLSEKHLKLIQLARELHVGTLIIDYEGSAYVYYRDTMGGPIHVPGDSDV